VIVEFIVHAMQCDDCKKTYTPHTWCSVVQLRQKADHKRSFYFLEQLILKHNAHEKVVGIKTVKDGLDFQFAHRSHAQKFAGFVQGLFPARTKLSKHLISHDPNNNTYNYKYSINAELCPVSRDDVVYLPKSIRTRLGGLPCLMLVSKMTTAVHLVDPVTGRTCEVNGTEYWKYPFDSVLTRRHVSEFTVLNVEEEDGKVWNVEIARTWDFEDRVIVRSHIGDQLKAGDSVDCYDMRKINLSGSNDEVIEADHVDVFIIRKNWPSKKNKKRNWVLKRLRKEADEDAKSDDADMEEFQRDLELNPEMRREINLYKAKNISALPPIDEDATSEPDVDLAELLDELTLNDLEEL
jgi:nonsense-mediated mRNA decay protein 3